MAIFVIASHCGHGYNRRIPRIILAQEPPLNSTVLLRYGQKTSVKLLKVLPFLLQKAGRIFCHTSMTKYVNISGSTQPFFTEQGPLDS